MPGGRIGVHQGRIDALRDSSRAWYRANAMRLYEPGLFRSACRATWFVASKCFFAEQCPSIAGITAWLRGLRNSGWYFHQYAKLLSDPWMQCLKNYHWLVNQFGYHVKSQYACCIKQHALYIRYAYPHLILDPQVELRECVVNTWGLTTVRYRPFRALWARLINEPLTLSMLWLRSILYGPIITIGPHKCTKFCWLAESNHDRYWRR